MGRGRRRRRRFRRDRGRLKKLIEALEWALAYSDADGWLLEEAADGDPVAVRAISAWPEIAPHLQFVWEAFWGLGSDRPLTMGGVGAIPFSSIDRYAMRFSITDPDQFSRFIRLLRLLISAES
ncbi:MAG: phage tail assembly chaperone [Methylocystis sp.]|uniref:phage tail assembly chaperone n=1 Tax=Methylocystis sp. TaxID=1911079 RepID=UPI003DA2ED39